MTVVSMFTIVGAVSKTPSPSTRTVTEASAEAAFPVPSRRAQCAFDCPAVKSAFALLLEKVTKPAAARRKEVMIIKRTISVMVGKGSVNHNSRKFNAKNTDPERTTNNIVYCNEDIHKVYDTLFGAALEAYNARQTRSDRVIENYYEKIRSGKQEKPFHEVIFQIGNKDDMNAQSKDGQLAAKILDEFMKGFQKRNPNLHVFSAHLHMDEATPHLHIDFVPFTAGSKRGLETRVSLKQALAAQGFTGGTRKETEWNQWVQAEKEELAIVMERHGVEWEQKGTHEKHLSVLEYEKKMRAEEVAELEARITQKKAESKALDARIDELAEGEELLIQTVDHMDTAPEWQLPEPTGMMGAKAYMQKLVIPFVTKLKIFIRKILANYLQLKATLRDLQRDYDYLAKRYWSSNEYADRLKEENESLRSDLKDYGRIRKFLGQAKTDDLIKQAEEAAMLKRQRKNHDRGR